MERSELLLDAAKFEGVFDSISTTLVEQTSVLRSMYNLDVKKLAFDKEVKKDAARDKALRVDDAAVQTQTQSNDNSSSSFNNTGASISNAASGLAALVGGALGGISVAGLGAMVIKGGFLALVAPKIGDFISGAINETLDNVNPPDKKGDGTSEFNKSISDGIGDAFTFGFIGRLFGKRVAAIAAAGGFVKSFSDEIIKKFGNDQDVIDKFGMEFDEKAVGNILTAIGAAIALVAPSIIKRALPRLLSRTMGIASAATVGAVAGAAAIDANGNRVDPKPRNFTRQADGSFISNTTGKVLTGGAAQNAQRTYDSDQDLMKRLDNSKYARFAKFAKGAGALGSVISIGYLASILLNENYTDDEKVELIGGELGAIFGGVGGAALAAGVGAAMGIATGPGAIITGIGGGIVGAIAGDWLGDQIAGMIVGSKNSFDEVPADVENTIMLPSGRDMPVEVAPRPTRENSGKAGRNLRPAQQNWDRLFGESYDPSGLIKPELLPPPQGPTYQSTTPTFGPDQVIDRQRRLQSLESNATNFGEAKASMLLAEGAKVFKAGNNTTVSNITNITKIDSSPSLSNDSGIMTAFS